MPIPAFSFVLLMTAIGATSPGCSCSDPAPSRAICSSLGLPGCGNACGAGSPCPSGLYCDSEGVCEADCTPTGDQCRANEMCAADGQCVPRDSSDAGRDAGGDQGPQPDNGPEPDNGNGCVDETVMADRIVPNVVVLVDQSGSMNANFGSNPCSGMGQPAGCAVSCTTNVDCPAGFTCTEGDCEGVPNRWDAVRDALLGARTTNLPGGRDAATGLFPALGDRINFILSLYTARAAGGSGDPIPLCTDGICNTTGEAPGDPNATCPQIVNIPISGGLGALVTAYEGQTWADETPTGESIDHVVQSIVPTLPDQDTFIILATDGEPDTCAQPNPQNGQEASLQAVEAAFTAGIPTFVIGVSINSSHFQQLANVGQGLARNEPAGTQAQFFSANDTTALNAALTQILRDRISCDVTLNGQVPSEDADTGTVILMTPGGNVTLQFEDDNGWQLLDASTIRINGTACDTWKDGESNLDIQFPCGTIIFG
ncbi:MAG: hypothetical protein R3B40_26395 [Polyangiales bacterium]|nr:hypothetical protein [Sandaracinaceae bacterium]